MFKLNVIGSFQYEVQKENGSFSYICRFVDVMSNYLKINRVDKCLLKILLE
jgi:hypothetical protein